MEWNPFIPGTRTVRVTECSTINFHFPDNMAENMLRIHEPLARLDTDLLLLGKRFA
ncbi:hypothetical protein D3C71_1948230 [compost metagenome]